MDELVEVADRFGGPDEAERERMGGAIEQLGEPFCTGCRYCMPCPQEIDIQGILGLLQQKRIYGLDEWAGRRYAEMKKTVDDCLDCGRCEEKCPQSLPIRELLKQAHDELAASPAREDGERK